MDIKQKKRSDIPKEYQWNLEDIFASKEDWQHAISTMNTRIENISAYKGTLKTGDAILNCLNEYFATQEINDAVYMYAHLKQSEDTACSEAQGMADITEGLDTDFEEASAFITPEILENDAAAIQQFIKETKGLALYTHYLNNLLRQKPHVLSSEIEAILASASEVASTAENAYNKLNDADMKYGNIIDEDGNTVELTEGRYERFARSKDRRVRKDASDSYGNAYDKLKNTFASLLSSQIKADVFFAKTKKYPSALDASLFDGNIPRSVYENLIKTTHEFLPAMHRFVSLRKKALKLDEYYTYDTNVSLVDDVDIKIAYDDAKKLVTEGLAPLGQEYVNVMSNGMDSGWVDVYETEGKTSGGFHWGALRQHPYILLNYEDNITDMFTLAHELGHAMHHYYAQEHQPLAYADYTTFSAEIASTVNEVLMIEYMLEKTTDKNERIYLLTEYIQQFLGTIFSQVRYAEFEMITHQMEEDGEPLTVEVFNKLYGDLCQKYAGPDLIIDDMDRIYWASIPHFYFNFYVYQYATGYAAAIAFKKRLQSKDPQALEDYLGFLKAGDSDYTINILKNAGVDMSSPEPIRDALKVFEGLIDELESCLF